MDETTGLVISWARESHTRVAIGINAHVCNLARHDSHFADLLSRSSLNYADGQSIVWAARSLGMSIPERVATTDLALPVLQKAAAEGLPVYFYGGKPGVAERAADAMRRAVPGVEIATHHGYTTRAEMGQILSDMRARGTSILFVGLGDPLQQEWVNDYAEHTGAGVVLTCGGLFDWLSGTNKRAPGWMISSGLEWLWRLLIEPKRLAHRYLIGNPAFLLALAKQHLTSRRVPTRIGQRGQRSVNLIA